MTRERWDEFVGSIKDRFPVTNEGQERLVESPGQKEFIEFDGPVGKMRCELIVRPKVIGQRGMGGHKVGAGSRIQYQYSADEETLTFLALRLTSDGWQEIDASALTGNA